MISDYEDGDLTSKVVLSQNEISTNTVGVQTVNIKVSDNFGNKVNKQCAIFDI